jgi:hypothetical protein
LRLPDEMEFSMRTTRWFFGLSLLLIVFSSPAAAQVDTEQFNWEKAYQLIQSCETGEACTVSQETLAAAYYAVCYHKLKMKREEPKPQELSNLKALSPELFQDLIDSISDEKLKDKIKIKKLPKPSPWLKPFLDTLIKKKTPPYMPMDLDDCITAFF